MGIFVRFYFFLCSCWPVSLHCVLKTSSIAACQWRSCEHVNKRCIQGCHRDIVQRGRKGWGTDLSALPKTKSHQKATWLDLKPLEASEAISLQWAQECDGEMLRVSRKDFIWWDWCVKTVNAKATNKHILYILSSPPLSCYFMIYLSFVNHVCYIN